MGLLTGQVGQSLYTLYCISFSFFGLCVALQYKLHPYNEFCLFGEKKQNEKKHPFYCISLPTENITVSMISHIFVPVSELLL